MSKVLIIEDSDPVITYTGNQAGMSIVGVLAGEYNTSTHQSDAAEDHMSLKVGDSEMAIASRVHYDEIY
jgi:beta-phosphoglucomutase-like phosphatase (HAD superfamily)